MAEREENREATWQYPEREGRGGQQNPPGDQGQEQGEEKGGHHLGSCGAVAVGALESCGGGGHDPEPGRRM